MLDFTSALYLGLQHPSRLLRPWAQFTTGRPAALASPSDARTVAHKLAILQGCERATLGPSTLHLFWDLFGMLAIGGVDIYMDAGVYPIARWGIERAAMRGAPVRGFPHHDADALQRLLKQAACSRVRPVVVADGFCPGCGEPAPIGEYLGSVREFGGYLVLDDTQALGILGHSPGPGTPYGKGGGGSPRWSGASGADVLVVSSMAKGFGVPMAVLAGNEAMVRRFEATSETRVHCSPPSNPAVHAAERALATNREHGDSLRLRLAQLVRYLRNRLAQAGLFAIGGLFPVQTLAPVPNLDASTLHERLLRLGVRAVLLRARSGQGARLTFIITARHGPSDIDHIVDCVTRAARIENVRQRQWR